MKRRTFLKSSGLSILALNSFGEEVVKNNKSVIWVWLGGGPSQFETFHANINDVPEEFRTTKSILHNKEGIRLGGEWNNLSKHMDKFVTVNSFGHNDSSHLQATHYMMTGHYDKERTQTSQTKEPSFGSIVSWMFNPNTINGMPTYVKQGKIDGEESSWLNSKHNPFDPSKKDNLELKIDEKRFVNRFGLLNSIDKSVPKYREQAYEMIRGKIVSAFNIDNEPISIKSLFGGDTIGKQMLLAKRLVENGTKFVTIHYGGWDMHSNIKNAIEGRVPQIDRALAALIETLNMIGMSEDVMVVVTGEFGRTKLNVSGGRDHWSKITPLLISGGKNKMGRTIGKSDKSYVPTESPFYPKDLACTIFDHLGIPRDIQEKDNFGRPKYLFGDGRNILI